MIALAALPGVAWAATSCDSIATLSLPNTQFTSVTEVAPGAFKPPRNAMIQMPPPRTGAGQRGQARGQGGRPRGGNGAVVYAKLPAFCRVEATLRPSSDSDIHVEVWLPLLNWNHRLQALGNGAFQHTIDYGRLAQALADHYVAVGSDTGHQDNDDYFAIGHPEKLIDWGYRAVHEMAVTAKKVIADFYGTGPSYSYWNSCSTGGRQGWMAAEYYPDDFDGLAIGDPANPMTRLQAGSLWNNLAVNKDPASFIDNDKWAMIHQKVLAKCDAADGLKDGLMSDPLSCHFDTKTLLCKNGDAPDCLTQPQLTAYDKILAGARDPRTGQRIFPPWPIGTDMSGPTVFQDMPDSSAPIVFRSLFQDKNWDYHTEDFDKDVARSDKLGDRLVNAVDPEKLQMLFKRGGKILMYHGWLDPAISPLDSINLYNKAVAANGGVNKTYNSIRLFMVPGMFHCQGGEGPNEFDRMEVLTKWVEQGLAPDRIVASHTGDDGKVDRTRPLCPYPQVAKYSGSGDINDAKNFACGAPPKSDAVAAEAADAPL